MVLGSTQPAPPAGGTIEVVRRRSGGGAVLVEPGRVVWADVVVPAGDPLWQVDVGRAAWWLGEAWAAALADLGLAGAAVHRGGLVRTRWSALVCFAGLGPGEVTVAGRKAVGISQRRTRDGALFQCAVPLAWDPAPLIDLLVPAPAERAEAAADLGSAVLAVPARAPAEVEAALLAHLP
ncbi:MAG: lipoyl protein ligase domain-containing protein [Actinomycetota bacterium]